MIIENNAQDYINKASEKIEKAKNRRSKEVKSDEIEENSHSKNAVSSCSLEFKEDDPCRIQKSSS